MPMSGGGGNQMAEYVIRLGTEMDNQGLNQLFNALDMTKLRAAGVTAALGALTTGVYKFVSSITKQQFEMEKLAKQKKKSIEDTWAEQQALKAMGVTLKDIKKDKALKEMYDDLVKFNKEMELPNADRAFEKVRALQSAFYKLKSAVNYVIQAIGQQVLVNLEAPINRITKKFGSVANWLKNNLTSVAQKIGSYISAFAKGVLGIVEGFEKIAKIVDSIPSSVKSIGVAVAGLIAFFNSGPLGKIIAAITLIGDIIHDYEVYQWNKANPDWVKENGEIPVAFKSIWDIISEAEEETAEGESKISRIATTLVKKLTETFNEALRDFDLKSIFGDGSESNGGLLSKLIAWFNDNSLEVRALGEAFLGFVTRGIKAVGGTAGGVIAYIFDSLLGTEETEKVVEDESQTYGVTLATSLGLFIKNFVEKLSSGGSIHDAFMDGLGGGVVGALLGTLVGNLFDEEGNFNPNWEQMGVNLKNVGLLFVDLLTKGIEAVHDLGGIVFTEVGGMIKDSAKGDQGSPLWHLGEAIKGLGAEDGVLGKVLSGAVTGWFTTGSFVGGIITGIVDAIHLVVSDPTNADKLVEDIKAFAAEFGEFFAIIWDGAFDPATGKRKGGMLHDWFKELWSGKDGEGGLKEFFADLASKVGGWLAPLGDAIVNFFNGLWIRIYNGAPQWIRDALGFVGVQDPNRSTYEYDKKTDSYVLTPTNGEEITLSAEQADSLSQLLNFIVRDENGGYRLSGEYQDEGRAGALYSGFENVNDLISAYINGETGDRAVTEEMLTDVLSRQFGLYNRGTDYEDFKNERELAGYGLYRIGDSYFAVDKKDGKLNYNTARLLTDTGFAEPNEKLNKLIQGSKVEQVEGYDPSKIKISDAKEILANLYHDYFMNSENVTGKKSNVIVEDDFELPVIPKVDTSKVQQQLDSKEFHIKVDVLKPGERSDKEFSFGGRINHEMNRVTVGEDGTEYIIPITKTDRALALINQMLNEMGSVAIDKVRGWFGKNEDSSASVSDSGNSLTGSVAEMFKQMVSGLGIGQAGTVGASMASLDTAMSGMTMNAVYNISAPVSINVNASGASAEDIGTQTYNLAERHLIKNLRGVYA